MNAAREVQMVWMNSSLLFLEKFYRSRLEGLDIFRECSLIPKDIATTDHKLVRCTPDYMYLSNEYFNLLSLGGAR